MTFWNRYTYIYTLFINGEEERLIADLFVCSPYDLVEQEHNKTKG